MINALKSYRQERARIEASNLIIGSMLEDTAINDAIIGSSTSFLESSDAILDEEEILGLIDKIPASSSDDDAVAKILASEEDLDVDDLLDIPDED